MASTIVTKNSSTASAVPLTGDLTQGELAVNVTDKRLFTKNSGGTVVELGTNPSSLTMSGGTANGVAYLNGSKVVTTGSALTFDGNQLGLTPTSGNAVTKLFGPTGSGVGAYFAVYAQGANSGYFGTDSGITGSGTSNDLTIYPAGTNNIRFYQGGAEQMRLTSTGLGIGTSSPGSKLTVLSTGSTIEAKQSSAGAATYYVMDTTVETNGKRWRFGYTGASGTAPGMFSFLNVTDNVIGPVIDSSGNLGLGVTPSASTIAQFEGGSNLLLVGRGNSYFSNNATFNSAFKYINTAAAGQYLISGSSHYWYTAPSGTAGNAITFTQAMTLDASGNLLAGTTSGSFHRFHKASSSDFAVQVANTSATTPYGQVITFTAAAPNDATSMFLRCDDTGVTGRIQLRSNGGIANYSANNVNLSDRREKTNFAPAGEYLSKICAIPVQTFNYIDQNMESDAGLTLGVVAQDVQAVAPELVSESNWGTVEEPKMRLSIYQTDLQYALMKCIQEQQALIQQLQADVAALKGN